MKTVEPKDGPDWKDGFLFVGNELALDFLNTCPIQNGEPVELLPDFQALLRWLQAAGVLSAQQARKLEIKWAGSLRAKRTFEDMRQWRERLREAKDARLGGAVLRCIRRW